MISNYPFFSVWLGEFGSYKTLNMAKSIEELSHGSNNIIFTNIKMREPYASRPNIYYYDSVIYKTKPNGEVVKKFGLLDILQYIGTIDDHIREKKVGRKERINFYIFEDELGDTYNADTYKDFPSAFFQYILQVRKIFVKFIGGVQVFDIFLKKFRRHIDWCYYFEPLLGVFPQIGTARRKKLDIDGKIRTISYIGKDEMGDEIIKEKPIDEHVQWIWWTPRFYKYYDDLFMNKSFNITKADLWNDYERDGFDDRIENYIESNKFTDKRTVLSEDIEQLELEKIENGKKNLELKEEKEHV